MSTRRKSASDEPKTNKAEQLTPVEVINRQRLFTIDRMAASNLSRAVLDRIGREDATLTITFIRDRTMRRLNRDYRGIDKPTDVLSFAYHETGDDFVQEDELEHLGDMVISVETADRYRKELGLSFESEIEHLIIHGTLHLAGYDHETDNGEMNRLEKKLRKELIR